MTDILVTRHYKNREDKEPAVISFRLLSQTKEILFGGKIKDAKRKLIKKLYDEGIDIDKVKYIEGVEKYDL